MYLTVIGRIGKVEVSKILTALCLHKQRFDPCDDSTVPDGQSIGSPLACAVTEHSCVPVHTGE